MLALVVAEQLLEHNPTIKAILEHTASALIAASVIGFSYEYLLHQRREKALRQLFDEHKEAMFDALQVYMLLTPENIFELLREIAVQNKDIPTLFKPARSHTNEFTFANDEVIDYFDTIVGVRRKDIIEVLRKWLNVKTNINLKFLASDFIAMYRLEELAPLLETKAKEKTQEWSSLTKTGWEEMKEEDKSWVLNYYWAYSRCETPMYQKLGNLLCATKDEFTQEWILFVPLKVPDRDFCKVIEDYLSREEKIPEKCLKLVIQALSALRQSNIPDAQEILMRFGHLFKSEELRKEVDTLWRSQGLDPKPIINAINSNGSK
jgi:hypothetical protein